MTGWVMRAAGAGERVDVAAPAVNAALAAVVSPEARLELLYDGALWSEGPAWWRGGLVFSDIPGRRVLRWSDDGSVRTYLDPSPFANGHAVTPDGRLVQCEHAGRGVSVVHEDGTSTLLVDRYEGRRLNSPNDVTSTRDGAVWFTDPTFGITKPDQGYPAAPELNHTSVYRLDPAGRLDLVVNLDEPNGIAFSPDERTLYVTQTPVAGDAAILAFDHDPATGALTGRRLFAHVPEGIPDGILVDSRGWVWSSATGAAHVYSTDGELLGSIPTPGTVSNLAFDGHGRRLFLTGEKLWGINLDGGPMTHA